ncbi:MAG: YfhO family protein [Lachnospira sp.]
MKKLKKFKLSLFDKKNINILSGNITYIFAFVVPVILYILLYKSKEIYPFGNNCYLRSDMYHQYAPFFAELWNKLHNGGSLTYSWDIGMGTNFTSLYAYYLASPSNWFIALFPKKNMIEIMNAIIILKIAGSSLTMTWYITKHFNTKSLICAVFGLFYGMSGFIAAYSWNIMWLDCILLLPLIMLGLERLVFENKKFLYVITLGLCIYSNYYIAFMVCLAVVIYFLVLLVRYDGKRHFLIYLKKILNFGFMSLLSGGMAACLLLPEMYTLSLSASASSTFPEKWQLYFSFLEMISRQLIEVPVHLGLEHLPNIYCGVAVFLLIPLYIMDSNVNIKEKIGKCAILLIFLLAFNLNIFNYIWHGFHFPNSLPCRQSFIYIFFVLTMSFEALSHIKRMTNKQLGIALWISIGLLAIIEQTFVANETYDFKVVYISGGFILAYALIMFIYKNTNWILPVAVILAFAISAGECMLNMDITGIGTTSRRSYLLDYDAVETVTSTVAENDKSFYRMDKIWGARSKNDGAWHNYKTISTFSSTANRGMTALYKNLGIEASTNSYGFNGSTLFTDSLFSIKYLISNKIMETDDLRSYYTGSDGEFIYENLYTLPLGYMIPDNAKKSWIPALANDGIQNQNLLAEELTGITDMFVEEYDGENSNWVAFRASASGHMYLAIRNSSCSSIEVIINDTKNYSYSNLNGRRLIDLGYIEEGTSIEVSSEDSMRLFAYRLDADKFKQVITQLNSQPYVIDSYSDTNIKGTVNATKDGTLLLSIPYDEGWSVYVDGKKTEISAFSDALICLDLTKGVHQIELRYTPVNLIKGCIITILCIIILIALFIFELMVKNRRIKTDNWNFLVRSIISKEDIVYLPNKKSESSLNTAENDTHFSSEEMKEIYDFDKLDDLDNLDDFDNIFFDEDDNTEEDKEE